MNEKIDKVFLKALELNNLNDKSILKYNEIEAWDSVAHMTLVAGLEEEFDCMLDMDDIIDMSSYDMVVQIMAKYV